MKFLLGVVVVCAIVFGAVYYGGGFASFDPNKQGKEAMKAIQPGMDWKKVIDLAGEPKEYRVYTKVTREVAGELIEEVKPGAISPFTRENIEQRLKEDNMQEGFIFPYTFSAATAFTVDFDSAGTVVRVNKAITMSDLLDR